MSCKQQRKRASKGIVPSLGNINKFYIVTVALPHKAYNVASPVQGYYQTHYLKVPVYKNATYKVIYFTRYCVLMFCTLPFRKTRIS